MRDGTVQYSSRQVTRGFSQLVVCQVYSIIPLTRCVLFGLKSSSYTELSEAHALPNAGATPGATAPRPTPTQLGSATGTGIGSDTFRLQRRESEREMGG